MLLRLHHVSVRYRESSPPTAVLWTVLGSRPRPGESAPPPSCERLTLNSDSILRPLFNPVLSSFGERAIPFYILAWANVQRSHERSWSKPPGELPTADFRPRCHTRHGRIAASHRFYARDIQNNGLFECESEIVVIIY